MLPEQVHSDGSRESTYKVVRDAHLRRDNWLLARPLKELNREESPGFSGERGQGLRLVCVLLHTSH